MTSIEKCKQYEAVRDFDKKATRVSEHSKVIGTINGRTVFQRRLGEAVKRYSA